MTLKKKPYKLKVNKNTQLEQNNIFNTKINSLHKILDYQDKHVDKINNVVSGLWIVIIIIICLGTVYLTNYVPHYEYHTETETKFVALRTVDQCMHNDRSYILLIPKDSKFMCEEGVGITKYKNIIKLINNANTPKRCMIKTTTKTRTIK